MTRCKGGGAVLANFLAVVEAFDAKFLSGRAPVERDERVCGVVDTAIRIMSILAAWAGGGGSDCRERSGGGDVGEGSVVGRWWGLGNVGGVREEIVAGWRWHGGHQGAVELPDGGGVRAHEGQCEVLGRYSRCPSGVATPVLHKEVITCCPSKLKFVAGKHLNGGVGVDDAWKIFIRTAVVEAARD